jgi:Domain of unknown function (DUF4192)
VTAYPDTATGPGTPIRAGSPAHLLAVIPHLLGFVPEASIVVIGTGPDSQVRVTLRYDLPQDLEPGTVEDIAEHALSVLASQRLCDAFVTVYGSGELTTPLVAPFTKAAREGGICLGEFVRAEDGRYWSYTCKNPECCPAAGTPYDTSICGELQPGPAVLPARGALATSIAPLAGQAAETMRAATLQAEQHISSVLARHRAPGRRPSARNMIIGESLAAVSQMVTMYREGGRFATEYQLAWLSVALKNFRVRDDAWARMDPAHRNAHLRLWTDLVRRAQPGYIAAPASLLAFVAWQNGNGALANVALDRALAEDPHYTMAELLRQVLNAGAPPKMARLPLTPQEVAEAYDAEAGRDDEDEPDNQEAGAEGQHERPDDDLSAGDGEAAQPSGAHPEGRSCDDSATTASS